MLVGLQFLGLSHLQFLGYYHSLDVFDQLQTGIIQVGALATIMNPSPALK